MERKTRTCAVCGKSYKFCNSCREDREKPLWYFSFCSEPCKNIYEITSKFEDGRLDVKTAKEQLKKYDLSKLDNFGASYKKSINKIMAYSEPVIEITEVEEVNEIQESILPVETEAEEEIKELVQEEKSSKRTRTKRVNKSNVE